MRENRSTGLKMALAGLLSCLRPCPVHLQGVAGRPCLHFSPSWPCLHLCPVSIYRAIYTQKKRGPFGWVALWWVVSPFEGLRTERLQGVRASFRISVYLGRWFQSCGPLGLRYNTGWRGLWPLALSCNNRLSGCVSSPWCGRFRGLQE